jgi:hypothetical protein
MENTKQRKDAVYFGFARSGNTVKVLEGFTGAASIFAHGEANIPWVQQLLQDDVGRLDSCYLAGPEPEVQKVLDVYGSLGILPLTPLPDCDYWNPSWSIDWSADSSNLKSISEVMVRASFSVLDWNGLIPLVRKSMERAKQHGCIFYRVLKSPDESSLNVHGCWPNAASLGAYADELNDGGGLLGEACHTGLVTPDSIYVGSPRHDLDVVKKALAGSKAEVFEVAMGLSRLKLSLQAKGGETAL